jgi:hypothetical protein
MKVRHKTTLHATCPVNGAADLYDCWVYVEGRVLTCEEIFEAAAELTREPVFQEKLTQALADRLGARVKTEGRHVSGSVLTTVVCRSRREGRVCV